MQLYTQKQGQVEPAVTRHSSRANTFIWISFAALMIGGKIYQAFDEPTRFSVIVLFFGISLLFILLGSYYAYIAIIAAKTLTAYHGNKRFLIVSSISVFLLGSFGIASGFLSLYICQHPGFGGM